MSSHLVSLITECFGPWSIDRMARAKVALMSSVHPLLHNLFLFQTATSWQICLIALAEMAPLVATTSRCSTMRLHCSRMKSSLRDLYLGTILPFSAAPSQSPGMAPLRQSPPSLPHSQEPRQGKGKTRVLQHKGLPQWGRGGSKGFLQLGSTAHFSQLSRCPEPRSTSRTQYF